jgi:AraC-like DNA-binding protein
MFKPATHGLPRLPSLAPEILPPSSPLPSGALHCRLGERTDCAGPASLRAGFARIGLRCEVDPAHDAPYRVDLSLSQLPGLQMVAGRYHGAGSRRTRALLDAEADDAALIVNLRGRHLIEQRGREVVLDDGEAALVSWTEPSRLTHQPPGEALALRFPRSRLAPLLRGPDPHYMRAIPHGTEALGLLTRYVALAWDDRRQTGPELQRLMVSHIYDLVAVLVGATADAAQLAQAGGLRAARLAAIKEDIERTFDRPGLSLAELAGRHGCTPRFVQRLFEAEGTTFTEYVVGQRVARAHRMLTDPRHRAEKVSTVAYLCGFGDVSYFNRVFRRHYGLAPSEVRASASGSSHPRYRTTRPPVSGA